MPECQTVRYRNKLTPVWFRNAKVPFITMSCHGFPVVAILSKTSWFGCHVMSCPVKLFSPYYKTEHFTLQNIFEVSALWGWARMSDKEYFSKKRIVAI
jgi:hypothetical protein